MENTFYQMEIDLDDKFYLVKGKYFDFDLFVHRSSELICLVDTMMAEIEWYGSDADFFNALYLEKNLSEKHLIEVDFELFFDLLFEVIQLEDRPFSYN